MARVLLIGENDNLLQTRSAVLARTDAEILCATPDQINVTPTLGTVDLLVICHTVRQDRREGFTTTARKRWPGLRIVQLVRLDYESGSPEPYADAVAMTADPAGLIAQILAMLTTVVPSGLSPTRK